MTTDTLKKQSRLSLAQRLALAGAVGEADTAIADVDLAATLSAGLGFAVSTAQVKSTRLALGLDSVRAPSRRELLRQLEAAREAEFKARQLLLDLQLRDEVETSGSSPA